MEWNGLEWSEIKSNENKMNDNEMKLCEIAWRAMQMKWNEDEMK